MGDPWGIPREIPGEFQGNPTGTMGDLYSRGIQGVPLKVGAMCPMVSFKKAFNGKIDPTSEEGNSATAESRYSRSKALGHKKSFWVLHAAALNIGETAEAADFVDYQDRACGFHRCSSRHDDCLSGPL